MPHQYPLSVAEPPRLWRSALLSFVLSAARVVFYLFILLDILSLILFMLAFVVEMCYNIVIPTTLNTANKVNIIPIKDAMIGTGLCPCLLKK